MRKLNMHQLQQIEDKLYNDYDFHYDDSKYEIIDHIASEIEEDMRLYNYDESFKRVFKKWENKLIETNWIGAFFYGEIKIPVFYKKQINKTFREDILMFIISLFIFPLFIYFFKKEFNIKTINQVILGYQIFIIFLAVFLNIYTLISYKKNLFTTVYGQIATYRNKYTLFALMAGAFIYIGKATIIRTRDDFDYILPLMVLFNAYFFLFIIKYCNYFRHLKTVNRIKNTQLNH